MRQMDMNIFKAGYDVFTLSVLSASVAAAGIVAVDKDTNKSVEEIGRKVGLELPASLLCLLPVIGLFAARGFVASVTNIASQLWCFTSTATDNVEHLTANLLLNAVIPGAATAVDVDGTSAIVSASSRTP